MSELKKWGGMWGWMAFLFIFLALGGCAEQMADEKKKILVFPDTPGDEPRYYFERMIRSSVDVSPDEDRSEMNWQALVTGVETGSSGKAMGKPYGIAAFKGRFFVSDTLHRSVMVFDPGNQKETFYEVGKDSQSPLKKPMGIKLDKKGNLYVMDSSSKAVVIFDEAGKFVKSIGSKEMFDRPSSVAVNPEGTRIFVVDTGSSQGKPEYHRIRAFDVATGKHLFDIGTRGKENGQFNLMRDATVSPKDGLLYVVDGGNFRIQVFDQEGKFIRTFGSVGRNFGQFARPKGIAISNEGNLYISDASHANFQIFSPEGDLLLFIGNRGKDASPANYMLPAMIAVDEDSRVFIVDQGYSKVEIYRPAGVKEEAGSIGLAFKKLNEMTEEEKAKEKAGAKDKAKSKKDKADAKTDAKTDAKDGDKPADKPVVDVLDEEDDEEPVRGKK